MIRTTAITAKVAIKRPCKVCAKPFEKRSMSHVACSPVCAAEVARMKREKSASKALLIERRQDKARLETMKPRAKWLAEAQAAFNAFIRERDAHLPCISCRRMHQGAHDAGHYRSVGAMPSLRFHEDNCHRQCVPCNQHKAGNVVEFRIGLIARIGVERVEFLEGPHEPVKHTIEDAKAIKALYRAKLKEMKNG